MGHGSSISGCKLLIVVALAGKVREGFLKQAAACRTMGSPFTSLVCEVLADRLDVSSSFGKRIADWPGEPIEDALPLRAAGGLNYLVLGDEAPALNGLYPPNPLPSPSDLWRGIEETLGVWDAFLTAFLDSPPQTNEVSRSAAILVGGLALAEEFDLPLEVYEVGASAGLNLWFDRYRYDGGLLQWGDPASPVVIRCDWEGTLPPMGAELRVTNRLGCDQRPLDPAGEEDRRRLLAYVWPDQAERAARIRAALGLARESGVKVERADAADWVERHFREPKDGAVKVLVHTVVWQYLSESIRERITLALEHAGSQATPTAGIAWLRMEHDGEGQGAGLRLRRWPSGEDRLLARVDFHGRWAKGV